MAVAEKNLTETTPQNAVTQLAMTSILGTAYLVAAILVVFHGIPYVWDTLVGVPLGNFPPGLECIRGRLYGGSSRNELVFGSEHALSRLMCRTM